MYTSSGQKLVAKLGYGGAWLFPEIPQGLHQQTGLT
jgi:hypothetical protein